MELREKIARELVQFMPSPGYGDAFDEAGNVADAILAIPEIAEALRRPSQAKGGYWERTGTGKGKRKWVTVPNA